MVYPCPSCEGGGIQDWRPESVRHINEPCVVCGKGGEEGNANLGCNKCGKPHCLSCIHKHTSNKMDEWHGKVGEVAMSNPKYPNWKDRSKVVSGFDTPEQEVEMIGRINRHLHQIQTAVRAIQDIHEEKATPEDRLETGPKHLRVGVNNALLQQGALVALLVEKGLITPREYLETNLEFVQREVESYRKKIKELTGRDVELI